jgi:hypothetical protein
MSESKPKTVFEYITDEETAYKTRPVPVADGWEFHMYEHVRRAFMMKHSKFWKGNNDGKRPFKNIIWPILNVGYRTEGFDVKDITPFVNEEKNQYKSFLVKKKHPRWAREHDLDTFIDEVVESSVDYDLALVRNVGDRRPERVPLQSIAFCDQTDVLSGPICLKHALSLDQVSDMKDKWYADAIELAITQAQSQKIVGVGKSEAKTPGKYIEVYDLEGVFPETWLNVDPPKPKPGELSQPYEPEYTDSTKFCLQVHMVAYYNDANNKKQGICLFKGRRKKSIYKALVINKIFGRACGYGGIEALFEPQVWTNYSEIQIKEMLDAASLMLQQTADSSFEEKNNLSDLKKNSVLVHKEGMPLTPVNIQPINFELFNNAVTRWEQVAQKNGSANDAQLSKKPSAGDPFKLQDLLVNESEGIHENRQGKIATFMSEIYRDWILPGMVEDMNQGSKWFDELTLEEMQYVAERIATNEVNMSLIKAMENGEDVSQATSDVVAEMAKAAFMSGGNKKFLEIIQNELEEIPVDVEMNIVGKQKDLAKMTDKLVNIFRQILSNPQGFMQIMQIPGMAKTFNEILEAAGLSPADFSGITSQMQKMLAQKPEPAQPIKSELNAEELAPAAK